VSVSTYKFGVYELDSSRFELRCHDRPLKLEHVPMKLLILLLEKKGQVVSRQEIIERLWGKDVFLDTEHGINTAVRKIRMALKEDVERPRFIQTISGKGYRFVPDEVLTSAKGTAVPGKISVPVDAVVTPASIEVDPIKTGDGWVSRKGAWAAVALLFVAGAILAFNAARLRNSVFAKRTIGPIHSVAVLPLANTSGDPSQDYYADGMTDELVTALAQNHSLRVISRTSSIQYKGAGRPLREIAHALGVDGILEGSVHRSANRVHINLQLIYAPTDTHVWAESYDRDLSEAMSLPEEVSRTIAKEAGVTPAVRPQRHIDPEAHDAYLMGRDYWFRGNDVRAKEYFEKAVHLQPDYAAGWAGMADTYAQGAESDLRSTGGFAEAWKDARKAVELDDSLPQGHSSLATLYLFDRWDWPRAEEESRRSVELNPNYAHGHHLLCYALLVMNHDDEALQEQKRADEIDPFGRPWAMGRMYIYLRRYDAAISELRRRVEVLPEESDFHFFLAEAYWLKGMWKDSERELEVGNRLAGNAKLAEAEHQAFERNGEKGLEEFRVNEIKTRAREQYVSSWDIAFRYAFLRDKEETLKFLETAYRQRSIDIVFLQKQPVFDFLHSDERYRALVKKIGLPPAY
jgi:TolB-like protein/DNA-binding winged helix-turn-helix (wHTH) protein